MSVRSVAETWVTVRAEGGLLLPDTLAKIRMEDPSLAGLRAEDYGLPRQHRLTERISAVWGDIQAHWRSFQITADKLPVSDRGTTDTRDWMRKFFRELSYDGLTYRAAAEEVEGTRYPISHRAGNSDDAPPIHIVTFRQDLNRPVPPNEDAAKRSPHGVMQAYLNAAPQHLWGIVTNGFTLRLLRDSHHFGRQSYIEFDLRAMLEGEVFSDFVLLYLLLHRSRLPQSGQAADACWLETWRLQAASEGTRARDALRDGVENAIQALGTGLMVHPHNELLRDRLRTEALPIDQYYRQLLKLVYRLLFLLVAEERDLIVSATADDGSKDSVARSRYDQHYSVSRLRRLAERGITARDTRQTNLWRSLLVTFDAMLDANKAHVLGLEPLGGGLFDSDSCRDITTRPQTELRGSDPYDASPMIANDYLLAAIRGLSLNTRTTPYTRVNYRDMDVEELGSVYESLLERQPSYTDQGEFAFRDSNERKSTGSYYTPSSLVRELVTSALEPVLREAIERGTTREEKRQNILALKVCDPACGSGHFLLAAARRMGHELARIDAGEGSEPDPEAVRTATREVIRHCIYGVDKNPLAIDLCKVALWIEGHSAGHPIGFLDNHVKVGDSLIGVFDLDVLEDGIPDDAYRAVTGDDKKVASAIKKRNAQEKKGQLGLWEKNEDRDILASFTQRLTEIEAMPESTVEDVEAIANAYDKLHQRDDWHDITLACHLWTWAFFAPMQDQKAPGTFPADLVPTTSTVRKVVSQGPSTLDGRLGGAAVADADRIGFFHWPLQFPEVFTRANKGFDVVLGNPPWEKVRLEEKEFFEQRDPEVAGAKTAAQRKKLIAVRKDQDCRVYSDFLVAKRASEVESTFVRTSDRFPLTGVGDVNTYVLFTELFLDLLAPKGRFGIIVQSGIFTDKGSSRIFSQLAEGGRLRALYEFENRGKRFFSDVAPAQRFCLLVSAGVSSEEPADCAFVLTDLQQLGDAHRHVRLEPSDFSLLNPNTKTCPIFRQGRDAELTKSIYRVVPVLVLDAAGERNHWRVQFKSLFHMANDSELFADKEQLEEAGAILTNGNIFHLGSSKREWVPLYEPKLFQQFDHRFNTFEGVPREDRFKLKAYAPPLSGSDHANPSKLPLPRYWIAREEVRLRASNVLCPYMIAFRKLINTETNRRTMVATVLPDVAANDACSLLLIDHDPQVQIGLLGNLNAFVLDFVLRQKLSGNNLNHFIVKQLPLLPPETYTPELLDLIVPRVLKLTYTAHDLTPFARDLGYDGPPFVWDEERRAHLRAELDGIYAHLYGLSRDDFAYILDTFPIVRRNDEAKYGEYRTKRLCLAAYDTFADHPAVRVDHSQTLNNVTLTH